MNQLEDHRLDGNTLSAGCINCSLLDLCGGYTRAAGAWNCMDSCAACDPARCTKVCLRKASFPRDLAEVGGFEVDDIPTMDSGGILNAPTFVPTIQHGYRRTDLLNAPWAALPLSSLFRQANGRYEPIANNAEDLRIAFRLAPRTRILLLGTGKDRVIERYWRWRRQYEIPKKLSDLALEGVIVPNFSFELSDPRPQHLHSRKRSLICARELTESFLRTVLVLQAVTAADWRFWEEFLSARPTIAAVAKDFQTGLVKPERGLAAINRLASMQDRLQRPLHLFAIGGAQYTSSIARYFDHWTVIGSTPFMKAMKRQAADTNTSGPRVRYTAAQGESPDLLLEHNILTCENWISAQAARGVRETVS